MGKREMESGDPLRSAERIALYVVALHRTHVSLSAESSAPGGHASSGNGGVHVMPHSLPALARFVHAGKSLLGQIALLVSESQ